MIIMIIIFIIFIIITGLSFQHGCGQQGWLQQAFHGSQRQDVGQGKGDEDNFCTFLFSLGQKIALVFRKEKRKIQNVNRITGHDEVCAEEGRQDGWKLPGDICNKYQFRHSQIGNGTIQALASFYKDDNYRSLLLEQGIKLLEMLITGGF